MKKVILLILCSFFFPFLEVFAVDVKTETEGLNLAPNARNAILMEVSSGKVLFNKNGNEKVSVASLTKMMGLILVFDYLNQGGMKLDEIVTTSLNAKNMGGTQIWLEEGEKISVRDLIKGVAMASANDAMVALAERVSGTEEAFVHKMNEKAKNMGLKNTYFKNSTGLDEEGHYSSAYDMALIAKELLRYEQTLKFTSVYEDYIRENTDNKTWLSNTNKLVRFYEGADGLKTGYTEEAKSCLVGTAKRDHLRLIAVVLGYDKVATRNQEAMDLLDYGFNQYKSQLIYKKGDVVGNIKLSKASKSQMDLVTSEDITILSKKTEEDVSYTTEILEQKVTYPIKKNTPIALLEVKVDGKVVKQSSLLSKDGAEEVGFMKLFWQLLKEIITQE